MFTRSLRSLLFCVIVDFLTPNILRGQQVPAVRITHAVDNAVRVKLPGNTHPLARAEFDQGEAPENLPLNRILLVLKRSDEQESALARLMEDQQNRKSPRYHQWLSPVEFGARFGPSDSDIATVTNWLQASGFQVAQVGKGRTVIEFSGTAGAVKKAFGTAIHKFVVRGEEHWANAGDPSIPAALAPVVAGVNSLHNFPKKSQSHFLGTYSELSKRMIAPKPEFTFGCGASSTCYGVTPYDFATIYDLLPLWNAATPINGTWQTIAIVGRTDINPADATTFWSLFNLTPQPTLTITHNGPAPGVNGDEGESDLDTQWAGAAAPGATINFVTSESTETTDGVDLSAIYVIDNNLAPVMSESYGLCEPALGNGGINFYGALWEQAAAQGITALVSAGDNGSAGCDDFNTAATAQNGLNVSGFASTPFNVAVGGTDFNQFRKQTTYWNASNNATTQESAKGYIPETTWNDSCTNGLLQFVGGTTSAEANCNNTNFATFLDIIGGSGGQSAAWPKPPWQTGAGVPNDNARDLPDVSLFAGNGLLNSFYVFCQQDQIACGLGSVLAVGGTSVSSPAFAGIMALVNQKWGPQGNANFVLYKLASQQPSAFHDIPAGTTNSVPCTTGTANCTTSTSGHAVGVLSGYNTTTGYDQATGLGSVDAANLVNHWNSVTFTPSTTSLTLNGGAAVNVTHGAAVSVAVAVSPAAATGDVALLVSPKPGSPAIDAFTLSSGAANGTTTLLPGGSYQVIAHYGGDTTFGGSYSAPSSTVTVGPETSSVFMPGFDVGANASGPVYSTSVAYGSPYVLRADVLNAAGASCTSAQGIACPTGNITLTDNAAVLDAGTFPLNSNGFTEDQPIQLNAGAHSLTAKYAGDSSYKPSMTTTAVTVTKAATAIANVAGPAFSPPNSGFTLTATATSASSGVAPTGQMMFLANGTVIPGPVLLTQTNGPNASLAATQNASVTAPGTYTVTATYSGDGNYAAVPSSNSISLAVFDFTTSPITPPLALNPGQSATTTITISPVGISTFTDAVQFGNCSGLTGITCTVSPTTIPAGAGATTATITIQTSGPFTGVAGTAARRTQRASNLKPSRWLIFGLPLAGIVILGMSRRKTSSRFTVSGVLACLFFSGLLLACGGGSSSPPSVSVSVSPGIVNTLYPNLNVNGSQAPIQSQQFHATVNNSTNQSVTWSVPGGSASGSVDGTGLYTAPPLAPTGPIPTVVATSAADPTKQGSATISLLTPTPAGTFPITLSISEGPLQKFSSAFNVTVN
jgi:subtilase family serine protease